VNKRLGGPQNDSGGSGEEINSLFFAINRSNTIWISKSKLRIYVQNEFGPHPASLIGHQEFLVWVAKLNTPLYSAGVKNTWSGASPPTYAFMDCKGESNIEII